MWFIFYPAVRAAVFAPGRHRHGDGRRCRNRQLRAGEVIIELVKIRIISWKNVENSHIEFNYFPLLPLRSAVAIQLIRSSAVKQIFFELIGVTLWGSP
jgi:hypothetical protein